MVGSIVRVFSSYSENEYFETIVLPSLEKNPTNHLICRPVSALELTITKRTCLIAEITKPDTGRVYRYNIEKHGIIKIKNETYFAIISSDDVNEYNRRKEYRVSFINEGCIQIGPHSKAIDCYIRDISPNGVGLSIDKSVNFKGKVGDEVSVNFIDNKSKECYRVIGNIQRIEDLGEKSKQYIIGCSVGQKTQRWNNLINREQRIELRNRKDRK